MEKLLSENETIQNQLSLTSKIKQSIESELVQSKLQHASELQSLIQKLSSSEKAVSQLKMQCQALQVDLQAKQNEMKAIEDAMASKELRLTELEEQAERSKDENAQAKNS